MNAKAGIVGVTVLILGIGGYIYLYYPGRMPDLLIGVASGLAIAAILVWSKLRR